MRPVQRSANLNVHLSAGIQNSSLLQLEYSAAKDLAKIVFSIPSSMGDFRNKIIQGLKLSCFSLTLPFASLHAPTLAKLVNSLDLVDKAKPSTLGKMYSIIKKYQLGAIALAGVGVAYAGLSSKAAIPISPGGEPTQNPSYTYLPVVVLVGCLGLFIASKQKARQEKSIYECGRGILALNRATFEKLEKEKVVVKPLNDFDIKGPVRIVKYSDGYYNIGDDNSIAEILGAFAHLAKCDDSSRLKIEIPDFDNIDFSCATQSFQQAICSRKNDQVGLTLNDYVGVDCAEITISA